MAKNLITAKEQMTLAAHSKKGFSYLHLTVCLYLRSDTFKTYSVYLRPIISLIL